MKLGFMLGGVSFLPGSQAEPDIRKPAEKLAKYLSDLNEQANAFVLKVEFDQKNQFEDDLFRTERTSLIKPEEEILNQISEYFEEPAEVEWLRPHEILGDKQPLLFAPVDETQAGGGLGEFMTEQLDNHNFLGALGAVATHPHLLAGLFSHVTDFERTGLLSCQFFKEGDWREVVIDTALPCWRDPQLQEGGETPISFVGACSSRRSEFWVQFIEKAYAKLQGSYWKTAEVSIADALVDLTGGVVEVHALSGHLSDLQPPSWENLNSDQLVPGLALRRAGELSLLQEKKQSSELWYALQTWFAQGHVLVCVAETQTGIPSAEEEGSIEFKNGLPMDAALSILDVVDFQANGTSSLKLVRVRSPWQANPNQTWQGRFKDYDTEWNAYPTLRDYLGYNFAADGTWWMAYEDFVAHFNKLYVCRLFPASYKEVITSGEWNLQDVATGPPRQLAPLLWSPAAASASAAAGISSNQFSGLMSGGHATSMFHSTVGRTTMVGTRTEAAMSFADGMTTQGGRPHNTFSGATSMIMPGQTLGGGSPNRGQQAGQQAAASSAEVAFSSLEDPESRWFNNPHFELKVHHQTGRPTTVCISLLQSDAAAPVRANFAVFRRNNTKVASPAAWNALTKLPGPQGLTLVGGTREALEHIRAATGVSASSNTRVWSFDENDLLGLARPVSGPNGRAEQPNRGSREVNFELSLDPQALNDTGNRTRNNHTDAASSHGRFGLTAAELEQKMAQEASTNSKVTRLIIVPFLEATPSVGVSQMVKHASGSLGDKLKGDGGRVRMSEAAHGTLAVNAAGGGMDDRLAGVDTTVGFRLRAFSASKLTLSEIPETHMWGITDRWTSRSAGGKRKLPPNVHTALQQTAASMEGSTAAQVSVAVAGSGACVQPVPLNGTAPSASTAAAGVVNINWARNPQVVISVDRPTEVRVVIERAAKSRKDRQNVDQVPVGLLACRLLSPSDALALANSATPQEIVASPSRTIGSPARARSAPQTPHRSVGGTVAVVPVQQLKNGGALKNAQTQLPVLGPIRRKLQLDRDEWFVESGYNSATHATIHLSLTPEHGRVVIVPSLMLPEITGQFSLAVFSDHPLRSKELLDETQHRVMVQKWDRKTAGGSHLETSADLGSHGPKPAVKKNKAEKGAPSKKLAAAAGGAVVTNDGDRWKKNPTLRLDVQGLGAAGGSNSHLDLEVTVARVGAAWGQAVAYDPVGSMLGLYVLQREINAVRRAEQVLASRSVKLPPISPGQTATSGLPQPAGLKMSLEHLLDGYKAEFASGHLRRVQLSLPLSKLGGGSTSGEGSCCSALPLLLVPCTLDPGHEGEFLVSVAARQGSSGVNVILEEHKSA